MDVLPPSYGTHLAINLFQNTMALTSPKEAATEESTKLRDSCNACAVSKVKCNKVKPTCARCAKRGSRCEYFATKRAGRKQERRRDSQGININKSSITVNHPHTQQDHMQKSTPPTTATTNTSSPGALCLDGPSFPFSSEPMNTDTPMLAVDSMSSWWQTSSLSPDANDWLTSPMSFPMPETPNSEAWRQNQLLDSIGGKGSRNDSMLDRFEFNLDDCSALLTGTTSIPLDITAPASPEEVRSSATSDLSSSRSSSASLLPSLFPSGSTTQQISPTTTPDRERPCATGSLDCCFIRATSLLQKLSPTSVKCTCQDPSRSPAHQSEHQSPTIASVIADNKSTLEMIHGMMQCPCSDDNNGYLLNVISLVVLKVLGWYKAAVQEAPSATSLDGAIDSNAQMTRSSSRSHLSAAHRRSCHAESVLQAPAIIDGYRLDGDDPVRMSAQLVLSELHRVQRLINVLAGRLKQNSACPISTAAPVYDFSPGWFGQLETELRERVRTLSLELIDRLR